MKGDTSMLVETTEIWLERFEAEKGVVWRHSGDARQPHPKLASGRHADTLFDVGPIMANPKLADSVAEALLDMFPWDPPPNDKMKRYVVVGPAKGATKLAELLSQEGGGCFGGEWFWASPTKNEEEGQKMMIFSPQELLRLPGSCVVPCEDVITTGGTVGRAAAAARQAGATILPFVLTLVNRSGRKEIDGREIVALVESPEETWAADECPLCGWDSEAVDPNIEENRKRLYASY